MLSNIYRSENRPHFGNVRGPNDHKIFLKVQNKYMPAFHIAKGGSGLYSIQKELWKSLNAFSHVSKRPA